MNYVGDNTPYNKIIFFGNLYGLIGRVSRHQVDAILFKPDSFKRKLTIDIANRLTPIGWG